MIIRKTRLEKDCVSQLEEGRQGMRLPSCRHGDPERLNEAISHHGDAGILAAAACSVCWHGNRTEA